MHELSVCQGLMTHLTELAAEHHASAIRKVILRIGPLSGVEAPLLAQAFPLAAAGSVAQGAELVIETQPVRVHCRTCGADSDASVNRMLCAVCGDWQTQLLSGDELLLASVELEKGSVEC